MYVKDFEFDGKRLSDFGCILASFNGSNDGEYPSGASVTLSTDTTSGSDRFDLFGSHYDQPYSVQFSIIKDPCIALTQEEMYFTPREISSIQRWLCRRSRYGKFKVDADGYRNLYWMGSFTSQQYEMNGITIGLNIVFTADSPYAHQEPIIVDLDLSDEKEFTIYSGSDEEGYIIPDLKITLLSGGDFVFENSRDAKKFKINNCTANEVITINGTYQIITSSNASHDLGNDCNYLFPRIFNTYDDTKNVFTSNLSCKIEMSYAPAMKVGI